MKLSPSWLLPALVAATSASLDARVYLLDGADSPLSAFSSPPTLSPEQARLVIAQRLGASKYHNILEDANALTLSYINNFGTEQESLFPEVGNKARELVLVVNGVPSEKMTDYSRRTPSFFISNPPSTTANARFVEDIAKQIGQEAKPWESVEEAITPRSHWEGNSKVLFYDLSKPANDIKALLKLQEKLMVFSKKEGANVMVVLMPASSASSKAEKSPYGTYDMPTQASLSRRYVEEPMNGAASLSAAKPNRAPNTRSNSTIKPITGVPAVCHSSLEACEKKTNECSGHGSCYEKRAGKTVCFTCGCTPSNHTFLHGPSNRTGVLLKYWGGAACQKEDVSGPFWLISIFTIVIVGLVSWAIGLMYSIGEEQLPGVIGAGVSTNKAR